MYLSNIRGKVIECKWVRIPCGPAGPGPNVAAVYCCGFGPGRRVDDADPPPRRENMDGWRDLPAGRLVPCRCHSAISRPFGLYS